MEAFPGVDRVSLLQSAMKVASRNHRLIANNIANADTPGYAPVHMDFQSTLRAALDGRDRISLRKTHPRHIDAVRDLTRYDTEVAMSKNDGNKVSIEDEMARLDENTSRFNLYGSLLVKTFRDYSDMLANLR